MSSRAYRTTRVNEVNWEQLARGKEGLGVTLGIDVGKFELRVVCRWADGRFERPWRVKNPWEIPTFLGLVRQVRAGRKLVVALEPSGTYISPTVVTLNRESGVFGANCSYPNERN